MARRAMSAKQRAALRKAQLASARKRRGTGKKRASRARRAGREVKRRYQAGHTGRGAQYRRQRDYYNSSGYYKHSFGGRGRKAGKVQRAYRKANTVVGLSHPVRAGIVGVSALRNRKRPRSTGYTPKRAKKRNGRRG